jgi:streptomycin 6-kinase
VVASLLPRLWREPPESHSFKRLADEAAHWADETLRRYEKAGAPFDRAVLDVALDVLSTVNPIVGWLVNQDLHGENILSAAREPWLVIDPKPLVGEREANGVALLRNAAFTRNAASVRHWLNALTDIGLDRERMRAWGVAHTLVWGQGDDGGWKAEHMDAARLILNA